MRSKAYHRFKVRSDYHEGDVQLAEALVDSFRLRQSSNCSIAVELGFNDVRFPRLNAKNTEKSRNIKAGHLLTTIRASFIKDLYEDFQDFLATTLARAALTGIDPGRFVGDVNINLTAKDILATGGWIQAVELISREIFRAIEGERNTEKLIKKIDKRLGLNIDSNILKEALPYFEIRHILVHSDGQTDENFRKRFPAVPRLNGKVKIDGALVANARAHVDALAVAIDEAAIFCGLVNPIYRMG